MLQTNTDQMVEQSRAALQGVRRALIELYAAVAADPDAPQDVSRRLGLNRNLTWKLSRVITAKDPFSALNHLPGQQGVDLALDAFTKMGAPDEIVSHVQTAMKRFSEVVDTHAGNRDQFELTLESMGLFEREYRMETGRELAFRGNSMIWGVQATTRLCSVFMAPNAEGKISCAHLAGLLGFRRLRPTARWRLFRYRMNDDSGRLITNPIHQEFEPKGPGDAPLLIREFCSPNIPEIQAEPGPDGHDFILPGGPVGKLGAFDCFFGYLTRQLPAYQTERDSFGSFAASISLPVENLIFDLIVHKDMVMPVVPEFLMYGFPHGGAENPAMQTVQNQLPIHASLDELVGSPPAVSTPLVPRYNQMAASIYKRMEWNPVDFRGMRVSLPFPPMSSLAVVRWPLPRAAG